MRICKFKPSISKLDSVTHIVLGACIGEAVAGRQLGKRALFLGAIAQSMPDIDFITAFWLNDSENLLAHRGLTHSILFGVFATALLARLSQLYFKKTKLPLPRWLLLFGLNIFTHIFIDSFNAYGTGWFEPFDHRRVSFHTIFVVDPLFSLGPLAACLALTFLKRHEDKKRRFWWKLAIATSTIYLVLTLISKTMADQAVKATLPSRRLTNKNYLTTPSPFNSLLWFVVVRADSGYYTGYHSVLDKNKTIALSYFPQNEALLREVNNQEEVNALKKFAGEYYTVEKSGDTVVFNVLRFGQVVGWYDPREEFVFRYYLDHPGANRLVTQRGRFKRWNDTTIRSLWQRIRGR